MQKNANNISTQYELQHVGALVYYVTGKTQVQSIEVWDASNIRHGLKEYKSALPLYEYTDLNSYPCDYTLTRDTK
ncbi:hypothetical protein FACS1894218_2690 [Bacilli bacterium]|nr:hypothetical protein FACS1894218_2690 [Bacilli bacterium]